MRIQWRFSDIPQDTVSRINFDIMYTTQPTVIMIPVTMSLDRNTRYMAQVYDINNSYFYGWYNTSRQKGINWIAIGY